jgi:hypothetical protein
MTKHSTLTRALCLGLLLLLSTGSLLAQASRTMNIGNLLYQTNEGITADDISWPVGWADARSIYNGNRNHDRLEMLQNHGVIVAARHSWTDLNNVPHEIQLAQAAEQKFTDIERVVVPVAGAFKRTYRNPYPDKMLDGVDRTDILAKDDPVDPNIAADAQIYVHCQTWPNVGEPLRIDIQRWTYGFANDDHDDYVINEYVFTNNSGEVREDVYLALTSQLSSHVHYDPAKTWGNYYGVTYHNFVAGDATADSMRIWYTRDADDKAQAGIDLKGEPHPQWGTLREPQYFSYSLIHVDTSPGDENDDPNQPHKAGWSQRELSPELNQSTHEGVYQFISGPWTRVGSNNQAYSMYVDADGNETAGDAFYRVLRPDFNENDHNWLSEQEKSVLMTFGPYTMQPNDDIRIVVAYAGGSISLKQAIDVGRAYKNGYSQQFAQVPLPADIVDENGTVLASAGANLTKAQKDNIIDTIGRQRVFANAGKARDTWRTGNVRSGVGTFNIPFAPATPSLQGFSENDQIRLEWGNEAETDTRGGTISGYRIYRDYKRTTEIVENSLPTDTTFVLHDTVPAGTFEYIDTNVSRGEDYYYYVTAVNTDGIESSAFLNRTGTSSNRQDEALAPTRSPSAAWDNGDPDNGGVVVVPNPYHASAAEKYDGRRLNFLNLPAYANIRIYTMTGDLVQLLEHDASTGDRDWERQDTFSTVEIVSGIYVYVVEELDAPRGGSTGKKAIGKFVVIK